VSSNEELVARAIENPSLFKEVASQLRPEDPDAPSAALRLITAFRAGKTPAWETAFLLGCIGHDNGYDTAKEILHSYTANLAPSYAGVVLVQIRGERALEDLREVILFAPNLHSREGAAYGIVRIKSQAALALLLEAAMTKRIRWNKAAWLLSEMPFDPQWLVMLLSKEDITTLRFATEIVWAAVVDEFRGSKTLSWLKENRQQLTPLIAKALAQPELTTRRLKREDLAAWIAAQNGP
jgi:hypothetical protein